MNFTRALSVAVVLTFTTVCASAASTAATLTWLLDATLGARQ